MRPLPLRLQTKSSSSPRDGRTSLFDATAAERRRRPSNRAAVASVVTEVSVEELSAHPGPEEAWEEVQAEMHAVSFFLNHDLFFPRLLYSKRVFNILTLSTIFSIYPSLYFSPSLFSQQTLAARRDTAHSSAQPRLLEAEAEVEAAVLLVLATTAVKRDT